MDIIHARDFVLFIGQEKKKKENTSKNLLYPKP
jgi:hypothetical protein